MKLQYLGDWRDAFKWDLLHWTCTQAKPAFEQLLFVPLLTPNDAKPIDGQIDPERFAAREDIRPFVKSLRGKRRLASVRRLGALPGHRRFVVRIHAPSRFVPSGTERTSYWEGTEVERLEHGLVFLDPDNGFETRTRRGPKWVLHDEVCALVERLPTSSAVIVYQHRPHRAWPDVFQDMGKRLSYAPHAIGAYDSTLALVALARNSRTMARVKRVFDSYAARPDQVVRCQEIRRAGR